MSRVDELASAARSPVAKLHELRLKYWNPNLAAVCCFEGNDDVSFYLPIVRSALSLPGRNIDFLTCGGKRVVIYLWRKAVDFGWNLSRLAFFVDRDLDDFIDGNPSGQQIYVTDYYSIESHAADESFFEAVWQQVFRLHLDDPRYQFWRNSFVSGLSNIASIAFPAFYLAVACKRAGGDVDFANVDFKRYYSIGEDGVVVRRRAAPKIDFSEVFIGRIELSEARRAMADLRSVGEVRVWLRGKDLLDFVVAFFAQMKSQLARRGIPGRAVVRVHFNQDFALALLCGHVEAPATLMGFLESWCARIKNGENSLEMQSVN